MAPGVSGPCTEATSCLWSSHTGNCPPGLVLFAFGVMTLGHMLSCSENSLSQTLDIYFPHSKLALVPHIMEASTVPALHSDHGSFLQPGAKLGPSNRSLCRRKSFTSPQSLVRCHSARGGQRTPSPLGNPESLLGATEWTLMGLYTVYVPYCHHYMCWSSVECCCFPFLIQYVLNKIGTWGSAQLTTYQKSP